MSLKQRSALRNVERTASRVVRSIAERDAAIKKARATGATLAAIGAAAGITRQRVHQLTSQARITEGERDE